MTPSPYHIVGILWVAATAGVADPLGDPATADSVVSTSSTGGIGSAGGIDSARAPREAVLEGGRTRARDRLAPSNLRVIGRDELSRAPSLIDLLDREPGVVGRRAGGLGNYATLSLRGSSSDQVEVWIDGVPLGGSAGSSVDVGTVALDGLERVEIRQAGEAGSGGAPRIDLVSRRGWAHQGASARVGSFGERALSAWWGDASGRVAVSGWTESADNDYPFPWDNGTVYNTSDDRVVRLSNNDYLGRGLAASVRPTESLDLSLRAEDAARGVSVPGLPDPRGRLEDASVQGSARWRGSQAWHPTLEAGARWARSEWNDPGRSTDWRVDYRSVEDAADLSAQAGVAREANDWLDGWLLARTRFETSDRESRGELDVPVTPSADRTTWEAEAGWKGVSPAGRLGAEASARLQSTTDGRDWTTSVGSVTEGPRTESRRLGTRLSGRLWARPADIVSVWLSAAHRLRPPDFHEWMGDNGYTLTTPSLAAERADAFEAGTALHDGSWRASLAAWMVDYRDPIEAYQVGSSPLVYHRNAPGYRAWGLDGRAQWCGSLAGLSAGGTLQDATVRDPNPSMDGNRPRRFPLWKGSLEATLGPWSGLLAGAGASTQGPIFASELNRPSDRRPGRLFLDSWLRWSRHSLSATVSVRNLLDEHPEDFEDIPLSGRQYALRVDLDLPNPTNRTPPGETP